MDVVVGSKGDGGWWFVEREMVVCREEDGGL